MKKLLSALLLSFVVVGCSNGAPEEPKVEAPEVSQTSFVENMSETELGEVRLYVGHPQNITATLIDTSLTENAELRDELVTLFKGLTLTESADQAKNYDAPTFFVDLFDANSADYMRFALVGDTVVVLGKEGFVNYDLDDASKEALNKKVEELTAEALGA